MKTSVTLLKISISCSQIFFGGVSLCETSVIGISSRAAYCEIVPGYTFNTKNVFIFAFKVPSHHIFAFSIGVRKLPLPLPG